MLDKTISVPENSTREINAHELINLFISDIYHEFNTSLGELKPGQKKYITVYKDKNFQGKSQAHGSYWRSQRRHTKDS